MIPGHWITPPDHPITYIFHANPRLFLPIEDLIYDLAIHLAILAVSLSLCISLARTLSHSLGQPVCLYRASENDTLHSNPNIQDYLKSLSLCLMHKSPHCIDVGKHTLGIPCNQNYFLVFA